MKLATIIWLLAGTSIVTTATVPSLGGNSPLSAEDATTKDTTSPSLDSSSPGKTRLSTVVDTPAQEVDTPSSGSPEEVCPCMTTDACKTENKRHVFGSDQLDITKFGLISPCIETDHFPCCPVDPPPPKNYNLTAADFSGLNKAELFKLGILNDKGFIGSSSIPLTSPEQLNMLEAHKIATGIKTQQQLLRPASPPMHSPRPPTYSVPQIFQQSFLYNNQLYRPVGYDSRVILLRRLWKCR